MRNFLKALSAVLVCGGALAIPSLAQAQEISLRLEPGVAVPLTDPQDQRFGVGFAAAAKPELTLAHYIGVGPSVSYLWLPSRIDGIDNGTSLQLGGFVRVKRPHDEVNTGTGFGAISPWIDGDAGYVRTQPLDRFGWSVGVGASVPTSDSRSLWVGPFVRLNEVHEFYNKTLVDTRSAETLIVGVSFEIEPAHAKKAAPPPPPAPPPPVVEPPPPPPPVVEAPPPPPPAPETIQFKPRIQFAWDSAVLDSTQQTVLADVVKALLADVSYHVEIDGHASSEGQVEHNNRLSLKRANAVRDFLVANGVDGSRLTTKGFGSKVPVADNSTEAGRVQNRRVEFDVTFTLVKASK